MWNLSEGQVKKGYGKGARTREPLTLNISEFGSATLIKAARIWNDSCMLLHIDGRDTIAMEIKYQHETNNATAIIIRRFRGWDWDRTWSALQYDGMDFINKVRIFCWKSFRRHTGGPSPRPLSFSGFDTLCHSWTIKTPKHVVLPMTVKSLTGNVELITILNRFCMVYHTLK